MLNKIVQSAAPVTLLGAGRVERPVFEEARGFAPEVVCADGGADHARAFGVVPDAVIGDLDSLSAASRAALPSGRLYHISEQDSTDFDKALRSIAAPLVLGVGFDGSRADHQLAALNVLVRRADQRCILLNADQLIMVAPPVLEIALPVGSLLSLFPMRAVAGRSCGLRWPIEGLAFAPDGMIGTSNEVSGRVRLEMDQPGMLLILPRTALGAVIAALAAQPAQWPATA
ncbi:thiamine diphosphokinase [Thalassobius sp. Cn5-15]|uniref:thiamine diphosphokinase n=1 Tax=Thalassobius sp. Cn5-15 TaxID=2917763 RepID=UPI001EF3156B|nr:thiamine diphosphokinase [Thalassobius sp. Cn5-15]MCG7493141.1 thiamine diphosphokinase [Thalassobius sp. Cn5-15]